jgi:site-specific recombinase XerC
MSRRHDPTKARRHWIYTREELCANFDVSDSTIGNWIARGLEPVDNKRPQLFAGYKVRQFITKMRWPHGRSPENGRIFCPTCLGFKSLVAGTVRSFSRGIGCFTVRGKCIDCHDMLQAGTTPGEVGQIFAASGNTAEDSSDVTDEGVLRGSGRNGAPIPPETSSSNLRWLYGYRIFLEGHQELDVRTVDEHLRAMSRMSAFLGHKPFETITILDVLQFKDKLRHMRDLEESKGLSRSTVLHTLDRCGAFFRWLKRRPGIDMDPDLPGYFKLSRNERSAESSMVKGTSLNFDQTLRIFAGMPASSSIELRDRAIIAMFIVTGIRIAALITLRGKHVNARTRWIDQDPREVDTKFGKHIRTYCLDLGYGLLDAITQWARWRDSNGFGDDAPFFLPDRYLQPNCIGLGYRPAAVEAAQCWKSEDPVQRIIKDAARAGGIPDDGISSHDFRKMLHPFLSKRGAMMIIEEIALQLNFGQTPVETIRKHYTSMLDCEREAILDELCRRALSHRTELELYIGYERKQIGETDPDYPRAKNIYERNSLPDEMHGEALL